MKQKSLALIALPVFTGLVLAGCSYGGNSYGGSEESTQAAETTTTRVTEPSAVESSVGESHNTTPTGASSAPATTTSETRMLGTAATGSTTLTQPTHAELVVSEVRVAHHNGFDRAVFEFSGTGLPGYYIGYTDKPLQQASGLPVEVPGSAFLEVSIEGTPMGMGDTSSRWIQPGSLGLSAGNIVGISHGAVFEGQSQYFIGLDAEHPYSVTILENPTRLVIDIQD